MKFNIVNIIFAAVVALTVAILWDDNALAADAMQFKAGNIIDDNVFTNSSSMSVQQIQAFLDSKVACDTWGEKRSELGGGTRRQWMAARGIQPPFRCVTDYRENPDTNQNNYGTSTNPTGSISAAEIIHRYSRQFNINPQVIIATLQKENGMITDEWPTPKQYKEAMGFGCPDNRPAGAPACEPSYGSFSTQIYEAARHFRGYIDKPAGWWVAFNTGWNSVAWHPNAACGRGDVNIENRATVALYSYTPYQPNWAAKNAQFGTGDSCSSYGNRNFYMYFTNWFGSVRGSVSTSGLYIEKDAAGQMFTGKPTEVSFVLKNQTSAAYTFKNVGVAVRGPNGENFDPGWASNIRIEPGQSYTYRRHFTPSIEGGYRIYMSSLAEQDVDWRECHLDQSQATCYNPKIIQKPVVITGTPVVNRVLTGETINELRQNQRYSVSYTIQNTSNLYAVKPGRIMIAGRTNTGQNRDMAGRDVGTLTPSQSFTYTGSSIHNDAANVIYNYFVATTKDGGRTYEEQKFTPQSSGVRQAISMNMKHGVTLLQGPTLTSSQSNVGAKSTVTMKVKNYTDNPVNLGRIGVTVRGPQGQNKDPLWQLVDNLSPTVNGGVHTYEAHFTPNVEGVWDMGYMSTTADYNVWNSTNLPSENDTVKRNLPITTKQATMLLEGPRLSSDKMYTNKPINVTLKVKTTSDEPVDVGYVGVAIRGPQGQNKDPYWQRVDGLSASQNEGVHTYQATFTPDAPGKWSVDFMHVSSDMKVWSSNYPKSDSADVKRSVEVNALPRVTVTTGVALSSPTLGTRQASFIVTNHSNRDVNLGRLGLAVRDPRGANRDRLWEEFVVPANSSRTHTVALAIDRTGVWSFEVTSYKDGVWSSSVPAADDQSIVRRLVVDVK